MYVANCKIDIYLTKLHLAYFLSFPQSVHFSTAWKNNNKTVSCAGRISCLHYNVQRSSAYDNDTVSYSRIVMHFYQLSLRFWSTQIQNTLHMWRKNVEQSRTHGSARIWLVNRELTNNRTKNRRKSIHTSPTWFL